MFCTKNAIKYEFKKMYLLQHYSNDCIKTINPKLSNFENDTSTCSNFPSANTVFKFSNIAAGKVPKSIVQFDQGVKAH